MGERNIRVTNDEREVGVDVTTTIHILLVILLHLLGIVTMKDIPVDIAADMTTILTVVVDAISVLKRSHLDAMRKEGANMNVDVVLHRYQSL